MSNPVPCLRWVAVETSVIGALRFAVSKDMSESEIDRVMTRPSVELQCNDNGISIKAVIIIARSGECVSFVLKALLITRPSIPYSNHPYRL